VKSEELRDYFNTHTRPMLEMGRKKAEIKRQKMIEEISNRVNNHVTMEHLTTRAEFTRELTRLLLNLNSLHFKIKGARLLLMLQHFNSKERTL